MVSRGVVVGAVEFGCSSVGSSLHIAVVRSNLLNDVYLPIVVLGKRHSRCPDRSLGVVVKIRLGLDESTEAALPEMVRHGFTEWHVRRSSEDVLRLVHLEPGLTNCNTCQGARDKTLHK